MTTSYLTDQAGQAAHQAEARRQRPVMTLAKLTSDQETRLTEARAALLWQQPFFAFLLIDKLRMIPTSNAACCPVAATDGECVYVNPDTFCKLTVPERVFVLAHEIAHCMWDHCALGYRHAKLGYVPVSPTKQLPYHADTMNRAEDFVINALLVASNVGQFNKSWLLRNDIAGSDSVIDAYAKIFKQSDSGGGGGGGNSGSGHGGFDVHLEPGTGADKDAFTATQERNQQEWATAIAQAAAAARARGAMPAALDRVIGDIISPPVNWRDHVEGFLQRRLGAAAYDWRRPDRRLLIRRDTVVAPGRSGNGVGTVVVGMDTSGSVNDATVGLWLGSLAGILDDLRPERVFVVWCDARVQRVDECEDATDIEELRCKGAPGGGGTRFTPVFDWVEAEGLVPDALVYLTDMYGSFPAVEPRYPVLWAATTDQPAPFGEVVRLPSV